MTKETEPKEGQGWSEGGRDGVRVAKGGGSRESQEVHTYST